MSDFAWGLGGAGLQATYRMNGEGGEFQGILKYTKVRAIDALGSWSITGQFGLHRLGISLDWLLFTKVDRS